MATVGCLYAYTMPAEKQRFLAVRYWPACTRVHWPPTPPSKP